MYRQTVCHSLTAVRGDGKVIGSGFPSWQNYLPFDWKPVMSSAWWADSSKVMKMPERHDGSQDGHSHYVGKNIIATISNAVAFGTRVNVLLSISYSKTSCWDVRGKMAWENLLSEGKRESWITKLLLSCTTALLSQLLLSVFNLPSPCCGNALLPLLWASRRYSNVFPVTSLLFLMLSAYCRMEKSPVNFG